MINKIYLHNIERSQNKTAKEWQSCDCVIKSGSIRTGLDDKKGLIMWDFRVGERNKKSGVTNSKDNK